METAYSIIDTQQQSCFVVVRGGYLTEHGQLYRTDHTGVHLQLALDRVKYKKGHSAQFLQAQGKCYTCHLLIKR